RRGDHRPLLRSVDHAPGDGRADPAAGLPCGGDQGRGRRPTAEPRQVGNGGIGGRDGGNRMKRVRKAVLPVAGLGTRVLPISKSVPKNLLNVVDRPILSYVLAEGRAAGIEHFVLVTGRGQESIEHYFD